MQGSGHLGFRAYYYKALGFRARVGLGFSTVAILFASVGRRGMEKTLDISVLFRVQI